MPKLGQLSVFTVLCEEKEVAVVDGSSGGLTVVLLRQLPTLIEYDQGDVGSPWAGHRTHALRLDITERGVVSEETWSSFSDVDGLLVPASSAQTFHANSEPTSTSASSPPASMNKRLGPEEPDGKAAALKAKRKRERERKKAAQDGTIGAEAERRLAFVRRSLQLVQEDFAVKDATHSVRGYEGTRDGGADWSDGDPRLSRLEFLKDNWGYLVIDTNGTHD
ncbi:hypothetical protein M407DRAFT_10723 [Tulasnella calospora MUT 4182]|uniref:Uncharacterized protein n=1 Tax=Tulasnella calospora MUT 4182 TaxID=1051891 RepID=A0A0C3PZ98_9AGAM|nr:hypothetical protein M407DRAFT_10723 [Tulasnella calospora MUT 4182]